MEHLVIELGGTTLRVRDLGERDIAPIVEYWHTADHAYLEAINVEPTKLVSREETARRMRLSLSESQNGKVTRAAVVVVAGDEVVAYSNIHIVSSDETYAHVHVIQASWRSRGLAAALFVPVMRLFIQRYPIRKLCFQTSTRNAKVNGLLRKFGLKPRLARLDDPNGLAKAGEFFVYELPREVVESWGG